MDIDKIISEITSQVIGQASETEQSAAKVGSYDASYGQYMDHTVLKPATTQSTVAKFCDEAMRYKFASVCVNPTHVKYVADRLKGSGVKTCCVIGFPLGANTTFIKGVEAMEAVKNGADEVDMVINIGALKDKDYELVYEDIKAVVDAAHPKATVKVIIETSALEDEEKVRACELAKRAGTDFVKTSTGFGEGGATVEDVRLMKRTVGEGIMVKASTGINDRMVCDQMLAAGAIRMGTSKGIKIIEGDEQDVCIHCGACTTKCPSGNVTIIRNEY
ncbi:MAG: deoxyribose-phosphate aldolase [Clostridia bacterium]|nr:deoxyribose-phosphate aldolase [Clostridia bacterium]MBT7122511.1 deoxyribose-phosphate aldolase [Clostridia bacterium]